jgi:hypothetical protein
VADGSTQLQEIGGDFIEPAGLGSGAGAGQLGESREATRATRQVPSGGTRKISLQGLFDQDG